MLLLQQLTNKLGNTQLMWPNKLLIKNISTSSKDKIISKGFISCVILTSNPQCSKKQQIVTELLDTEINYVQGLSTILEVSKCSYRTLHVYTEYTIYTTVIY